VLITREDYREGGVTREGERITGDAVLTRQTAEVKWDSSRRERTDLMGSVVRDCRGEHDRHGGGGRGGGGRGGRGGGGRGGGGRGGGGGGEKGLGLGGGQRGAHAVTGLPRSKPSFTAR